VISSRRKGLQVALSALVLVGVGVYLGWQLASQWGAISHYRWQVDCWLLAASVACAGGWYLCRALLWQMILGALGCRLPFRLAFRTWVLSELGRYLPGKVWYVAGRAYLCAGAGVPAGASLTGMGMELALVAATASGLGLLRLGAARSLVGGWLWPGVAGLALLVALTHPRLLRPAANLVLARLHRDPLPPETRYSYPGLLGVCLLMWAFLAAGFFLFARAVAGVAWGQFLAVASSFAAAWVLALVVVVTPGGMGVREGVLAAMLAPVVPAGVALPLALLSRLWITAVELACALAALRIRPLAARK